MDNDVWEYFVSVMTRALVASIIAAFVIGALVGGCVFGQDGYDPDARGETLAEEKARIDGYKTKFAYVPQHTGPVLDGVCGITAFEKTGTSTWCGVAISDTEVITCAHHRVTGPVRLEFCVSEHGNTTRVTVPGDIVRSDRLRDLSLIRFKTPAWLRMRSYVVGRVKGRPAIKGFLDGSDEVRQGPLGRTDLTVDGFNVVELNVTCQTGLSGSPLVEGDTVGGILIGSGGGVSHLVSPETIKEWLK